MVVGIPPLAKQTGCLLVSPSPNVETASILANSPDDSARESRVAVLFDGGAGKPVSPGDVAS